MDAFTGDQSAATDTSTCSRPVRFEFERLMRGTVDRTGDPRRSDRTLRLVVGSGRASVLHGPGMPAVLVPLRGHVKLVESASTRILHKGRLFLSEGGNHVQAIGSNDALWV